MEDFVSLSSRSPSTYTAHSNVICPFVGQTPSSDKPLRRTLSYPTTRTIANYSLTTIKSGFKLCQSVAIRPKHVRAVYSYKSYTLYLDEMRRLVCASGVSDFALPIIFTFSHNFNLFSLSKFFYHIHMFKFF